MGWVSRYIMNWIDEWIDAIVGQATNTKFTNSKLQEAKFLIISNWILYEKMQTNDQFSVNLMTLEQ
jgi:hypothetical protein